MCCPMSTTSSRPLPPDKRNVTPAGTVPLTFRSRSASYGCTERWREDLQPARHSESDAAKTTPWPGATPSCGALRAQNPFGLQGSLPATGHQSMLRNLLACRVIELPAGVR